MRAPRRFLPSLPLLAAFEAAARTGSVTAAAAELSLTQSAVSRQIKALEEQLGVALFHRERQTIRLTFGGEAYAREIREALYKISAASLNLRANPMGGTLTLAILPTFGTRWLAPRLPRFLSSYPGVTINLITRISAFDFRHEAIDAAIHFGQQDWPGTGMALLRPETVLPVCAPMLRDQYGFAEAADIRAAPLLHLTTRPDAWERWLRLYQADAEGVHGMLFDQFATLAQAAIAGLGVALIPAFLIAEELAAGKLVPALDLPMQNSEAYHLCWPLDRASHPPLVAFRDWILAETAPDR
ncbi:LysR family transcriptional regulator (plasmid) [Gemmobacter fulvus]|uniref:LysR family transcriptional regulator n=1 Tax=Gemmobacter fulvus TaxID=2840474 RepID=A0A975PA61_9RHOB|nr:LysR family transcriptional regulator [Gemmobacter fulvus]MBT9246492.1 LysR family transcriptional regulator [Gemmobacter fulvus]QWK92589.1 LysR family transcriptional regulator [Gemmobacter fulvus]